MARTTVSTLSIHVLEHLFADQPVVRMPEVPGHERDVLTQDRAARAVEAIAEQLDVEHPMHSQAAVDALDVVGYDDARIILDQMAYAEWEAMERDEFMPDAADDAIAFFATQG